MGDEPSIWEVMQKQAEQFKEKEEDLRRRQEEVESKASGLETKEQELAAKEGELEEKVNALNSDKQTFEAEKARILELENGIKAREAEVTAVLSNSFGFGSVNACLVLGNPPRA